MTMPRPVHFEIHATDPQALGDFYSAVFGWTVQQWGDIPYWLVMTGDGDLASGKPDTDPGINGAILPRRGAAAEDGQAVNAYVCTIGVDDVEFYWDKAINAGASVALPLDDMAGVGKIGYLKDPDGNLFGMIQPDPASMPQQG